MYHLPFSNSLDISIAAGTFNECHKSLNTE